MGKTRLERLERGGDLRVPGRIGHPLRTDHTHDVRAFLEIAQGEHDGTSSRAGRESEGERPGVARREHRAGHIIRKQRPWHEHTARRIGHELVGRRVADEAIVPEPACVHTQRAVRTKQRQVGTVADDASRAKYRTVCKRRQHFLCRRDTFLHQQVKPLPIGSVSLVGLHARPRQRRRRLRG